MVDELKRYEAGEIEYELPDPNQNVDDKSQKDESK